jgi:hypothetical protein
MTPQTLDPQTTADYWEHYMRIDRSRAVSVEARARIPFVYGIARTITRPVTR